MSFQQAQCCLFTPFPHCKGLIKEQVRLFSHKQNCKEQHNALSSLSISLQLLLAPAN